MLMNVNEKQHGVKVYEYGIEYIITDTAKISKDKKHDNVKNNGNLRVRRK